MLCVKQLGFLSSKLYPLFLPPPTLELKPFNVHVCSSLFASGSSTYGTMSLYIYIYIHIYL